MNRKLIRVAVGMSGGIDSAMAAAILKEKGYEVIGITMRIWDGSFYPWSRKAGCLSPDEDRTVSVAKDISSIIGIEHYVIDMRDAFRETVIGYFCAEYAKGRTPNPCVLCNAKIKLDQLIGHAFAEGISFDLFATGHYARIWYDPARQIYLLKRGVDRAKDQSYFLYKLSQKQLSMTLFPLGDYQKGMIRQLAERSGLGFLIKRPESQDFLKWDDYSLIIPGIKGDGKIVDIEGRVIGRHKGITRYTVGQRKGLNLAGMEEPYYVLHIDAERNEVIAGPKRFLLRDELIASELNFIIPYHEVDGKTIHAQIRYRSLPAECTLVLLEDHKIRVRFKRPQEAITPGQSVVFYAGDTVIGGGIIEH